MGGICGVDEAGRGPVIGPMVVAGVLVEEEETLRMLGVRDSKKLEPRRREALAQKIVEVARSHLIVMPAKEIDLLREEMTINQIEMKLFATVIERLKPDIAYVDSADVNEEKFGEAIKRELDFPVDIVSKHGADALYPAVSAASILAKTTRDAEVRRIEEEIGRSIGSGYPADPNTIAFLEEWIREKGDLPPHTRRSWETSRRLLSAAKARRLNEFEEG